MGKRTLARGSILAAVLAAALCRVASAAEPGARPRRVLSIHAFEPSQPVNAVYTAGLRNALAVGTDVAFYSEFLDRVRFPDEAYAQGFREWLRAKYASAPPDVVVAVGAGAVEFLANPATTPFPGVPVVFGMVVEGAFAPARLPSNFTGFTDRFSVRETLELALALFPDTERVVLVGGASAQDRPMNELLRREVAASGRRLETIELFGLPMADVQARLGALPPRSIVLILTFLQDGAGRQWGAPQCIPAMVSVSSAPIFTALSHVLGLGVTGGVMTDFDESGRSTARIVQRVLAGERVEAIPVQRGSGNRALLDGHQLDRWRVPAARVPASADVRFREPSAWARYRRAIVLFSVGLLFQSGLIALLLFERRRRWRAEAGARESLAILAHMNRVSAVGELVGSLAHEINSPLGAALNNAEAAQRLMSAGRSDEREVASCLEDIVRDVTRAGEVLRRIRGALRREARAPVEVDVTAVIRDALQLVKAEARDRQVSVDVEVTPGLPAVSGDEVQLSQVILNLVLNALDAVRSVPEARRRIRIAADRAGDRVAIRVEDSGPGVAPALADRVFEPFFTTKTIGLGMGLAITRSIVQAHHGTIRVSSAPDGGAAFEVLLPAATGPAADAKASALG